MNHLLLMENQKKYADYPIWLLLCFSLFNYWKLSVVFFTIPCFPFEPRLSLSKFIIIFIAANLFSIFFSAIFPEKVVWAERILTLFALGSVILLLFPLPNEFAIGVFLFHAVCCFSSLGFEYFIIANLFSEKSAITYVTLGYGFSFILVAILHNHFIRFTFLQYKISTIIILLLLLVFYFRLPIQTQACPSYFSKQDGFVPPAKMILGMFALALVGSFMAFAGPMIAGIAKHGTCIIYVANVIGCFILYACYRKKNFHPFHFVSTCLCFGCIGPLLMYASFWLPTLKYVACVCIGLSMIPSQLAPLCVATLMRIYPSRYLVPITSGMFLISFVSQHIIGALSRESIFSYYVFLAISMIILAIFYLQIAPTFLYVLGRLKRETLSKMQEMDSTIDTGSTISQEVKPIPEPVITEQTQESDILQKLSKRELEVVDLIGQGYTNADIAKLLFISAHTVNDHTKNIYRKLDVHSRYELIALVNQNKNGGA